MPKKKINLSEIYTRNDIKQMPIFASTVLYDFLYDYSDLSSDEKKDLLRRMNDISIMAANTDYIVPLYGNTYPILTKPIKEAKYENADEGMYPEMLMGKKVKLQNYYLTMTQDGNVYPTAQMNEPLQVMQNALKTISKHMGRFMKKGRIMLESHFLVGDRRYEDGTHLVESLTALNHHR